MTIKQEYELRKLNKMQYLINARNESKMSQRNIAEILEVSLKSIQRFESYESTSDYLLFGYKKLFNENE